MLQSTRGREGRRILVGQNGDHELARLECLDHTRYQVTVVGGGHIRLKAHVRELVLGSDVDGHVAALEGIKGIMG